MLERPSGRPMIGKAESFPYIDRDLRLAESSKSAREISVLKP